MEREDVHNILNYLFVLQNIASYKNETTDHMTPYTFETMRQEAHNQMVRKVILPMLNGDVDESEVYIRTKMITDNLDKIWNIYDGSPFSLLDDECIHLLARYLRKLFLSTECKYYLEGVTAHLHGIDIPKL